MNTDDFIVRFINYADSKVKGYLPEIVFAAFICIIFFNIHV